MAKRVLERSKAGGVMATLVRRLNLHEEEVVVQGILAANPPLILAASDLHLGPGRYIDTGVYDARENFFMDEAFGRWLTASLRRPGERLLVLIGDVFDFTRLCDLPRSDASFQIWSERLEALQMAKPLSVLKQDIVQAEKWFGLRTNEHKSIWKLYRMIDGHPTFMRSLASWIQGGDTLLMVKGNHDLEVYWDGVRQAFRHELVRHGVEPAIAEARVGFVQGSFNLGNLYFEHGHMYEPMTCVKGSAVLKGDDEINYPLGSFLNRYIVNKIERLDPFIDNIKPVQDAVLVLLRQQPLRILRFYFRAWRYLWRVAQQKRLRSWTTFWITLGLILPPLLVLFGIAVLVSPSLQDALKIVHKIRAALTAGALGFLLPSLLPYLVGAAREVGQILHLFHPRDHVAEGAEGILENMATRGTHKRVYVVMGHTHRQDARSFKRNGVETIYINTGTWIPLWPKNRQDLIGKTILSFASFERGADGEFFHQCCEWDDEAREARPARILRTPVGF
jgi:UDP-2,3-diacylglucosamine pyrophosphatase LpxH